jgi:hypothetical protein
MVTEAKTGNGNFGENIFPNSEGESPSCHKRETITVETRRYLIEEFLARNRHWLEIFHNFIVKLEDTVKEGEV